MRLGVISEKENEHARIFLVSKMHLQPFSGHGAGHNSHEFFADGSTRLLSESKWVKTVHREGGKTHIAPSETPPACMGKKCMFVSLNFFIRHVCFHFWVQYNAITAVFRKIKKRSPKRPTKPWGCIPVLTASIANPDRGKHRNASPRRVGPL